MKPVKLKSKTKPTDRPWFGSVEFVTHNIIGPGTCERSDRGHPHTLARNPGPLQQQRQTREVWFVGLVFVIK